MKESQKSLRDLDSKLRAVRFGTRASFGAELMGRIRRGEEPAGGGRGELRGRLAAAAVAILTIGGALALASAGSSAGANTVTVDRCCYDLDGGGDADDGVLILAERNDEVHRLRVYEDLDGSRSFTPSDLVRLDRGGEPAIHGLGGKGIVTIERCCVDFDGGGPDDDGLLVMGVPPDRVLMAAIYETAAKTTSRNSRPSGWPLR
jgi:hypothetical protein